MRNECCYDVPLMKSLESMFKCDIVECHVSLTLQCSVMLNLFHFHIGLFYM